MEIKYFSNLMSFLEKMTDLLYLKFTKGGIQGIQIISNENSSKDTIDNVSSFVIPKHKLYSYVCNTQEFDSFDEKHPNDSEFRLRFISHELCDILKSFKVEDTLILTYYKGDKIATVRNDSTNSDVEITVRYSKKPLTNPIESEISLYSYPLFMNIICRRFCEIVTRMTKKKDKLANKMYIKIQSKKRKGIRICSSEQGVCKNFGDYITDKEPELSFKIDPQVIKYLSYFTKGNDRGFLEFYYNGKIIKLSINLGTYIRHDFLIVAKIVK